MAFLLAMVALSLAAFPIVAISYSKGLIGLAPIFALARLVLQHAIGLEVVGFFRDQVNKS
jgi:hypothetical protein